MKLEITLNQDFISSLKDFMMFDNRCSNMHKNTVFVIQNGTDDEQQLLQWVKEIDQKLTDFDRQKKSGYFRTGQLDSYLEHDERIKYNDLYERWRKDQATSHDCLISLPFHFENNLWDITYRQAFSQITTEYSQTMKSELKLRNFVIILFKWIDTYFPKLFINTRSLSKFPKFVYLGYIKANEYQFFRLLALCGCDVYCINLLSQLDVKWHNISFTAQILDQSKPIISRVPEYQKEQSNQSIAKPDESLVVEPDPSVTVRSGSNHLPQLDYEELAQMAASVVMITVYDQNKKPFATGSGVLINHDGYILTNFHVVKGGAEYAIKLEDDERLHYALELIKYHSLNDLALLRIDPVQRPPIPLYTGNNLIRGQKVVAIGSPLGLFNTVSDGIIAGFRELDEVSMIQFTAPTSHGSSGGALLNRYGQLIGIVTAGFHDGQNLNLAVDYQTVYSFLRGFI